MKFLHSPSNSSSSAEIRPNFATAGCVSTLLRRLLCFHSLPTAPFESDGQNELDGLRCDNQVDGNPGIVAKLMGLDSIPLGKSNCADNLGEWKLQKGNCCREAPSFVEIENEKFIVLSFEGGGRDKELELKSSKSGMGLVEFKEKTRKKKKNGEIPICGNSENDGEAMDSSKLFVPESDFNKNSKNLCDKRGRSRNNRLEKVEETESDSENSSPVSVLEVLEFLEFPSRQEASNSAKQDSKSKISNLKRELRGDLDKNSTSSCSRNNCNDYGGVGSKKKSFVIDDFGEMWGEICKMVEKDVMDSSRMQRERWKSEEFEEICVSFELKILDQLIFELFTCI